MPKLKTHRGAAKRLKVTSTGKIQRTKAFRRHLLVHKSRSRKRSLKKSGLVASANIKSVRRLLPYQV